MFPFFKPPIENKHQFLMFFWNGGKDIVFSKAAETSASSLSFLAHGVFRPTPQLSILFTMDHNGSNGSGEDLCKSQRYAKLDTLWWTYKKLWKMAIYSGFSHENWWFSIAMLNYQRVHFQIRANHCGGASCWTNSIWWSHHKNFGNLDISSNNLGI